MHAPSNARIVTVWQFALPVPRIIEKLIIFVYAKLDFMYLAPTLHVINVIRLALNALKILQNVPYVQLVKNFKIMFVLLTVIQVYILLILRPVLRNVLLDISEIQISCV